MSIQGLPRQRPPLSTRILGVAMRLGPGLSTYTPDQLTVRRHRAHRRGSRPGRATQLREIATPTGGLRLRIHTPRPNTDSPRPIILHIHGGGWIIGSPRESDWSCRSIAAATGAIVVSVEYRLAPSAPYPAALDDCYAALLWLSEHAAELGGDAARIAVLGESAGGNLAAALCLRARAQNGPRIVHQTLLYPPLDATMSSNSYRANAKAPILGADSMRAAYRHYLPDDADPRDPFISPVHAEDLRGLPPATIVVAGNDPLHDDGLNYANKLQSAGVPVEFHDFPRMVHGFMNVPWVFADTTAAMNTVTAAQLRHFASATR